MTPVSMTRAEYQRRYGVTPVAPATSTVDTTPAPLRMTREEYTKQYGQTPEGNKINNPVQNIIDRKPSFPANEDTSSPLGNIARTFGNIPSSAINLGRTLVTDPAQNILESDKAILDIYKNRGPVEGTKDILGGFADTYLKAGEAIYGGIEEAYNALLDNPKEALAKTSNSFLKVGIEDPLLIPSLLYGGGAVGRKDIISRVASPVTRGVDTSVPTLVAKAGKGIEEATADISKGIREKQVADTADEIYAVEQNYSKARKLNQYSTDGGAEERARIARSNVLEGSVTTDGVIRTKQPGGAVDRYRELTIDGREDIVRKGLEREGAKVNLEEIRRALVLEVNRSGLEGADLITAMNGIKKELAGLARRADESGNIFLAKLHDAKIGTTRNINYQTPPETATYRKAVARAYKNTIENKSSLNVREVNDELAKYYKDIERLEGLDGLRVKGGKLGKYTAQIAGNVGGGLVGGAIGGVPGAAIGTVVGGEISSALKGRALSKSFGKLKEGEIPRSSILENAKAQNELPKVLDLKTPDPVVGVRKDIPKTKEVIEIEAQIKNNVRKQKLAIKAGDFTLVEKLKEIYQALVEKLREVVKVITEKGPPQRGFIRIGGKDAPKSRPKSSAKSPSHKSTTEPETFKGFTDLSTKLLEKLKGRSTVSRQFIEDMTNQPDLKQAERDLIRRVLGESDGGTKVYHGTNAQFDAFDASKLGTNEKNHAAKNAFFFSDSKQTASTYGKNVKEAQLKFDNPVTIDAEGKMFGDVRDLIDETVLNAKKNGNDGVIIKNLSDEKDWGVYNPTTHFAVLDTKAIKPVSDQISVPDFANKVKSELLPLTPKSAGNKWEMVNMPDELRGPVSKYEARVYQSPIKTSAGEVHYNVGGAPEFNSEGYPNYFAHSRIEDLPTAKGLDTSSIEAKIAPLQEKIDAGKQAWESKNPGQRNRSDLGDLSFLNPKEMDEYTKLNQELSRAKNASAKQRVEGGGTRRVIELQSDLFQKGRLEQEGLSKGDATAPKLLSVATDAEKARWDELSVKNRTNPGALTDAEKKEWDILGENLYQKARDASRAELSKLEPYRNTWHERVIREEIKQAAKDGKTKLQFPTGETAMKIEGLGETGRWAQLDSTTGDWGDIAHGDMKVGMEVAPMQPGFAGELEPEGEWIITDVLGDGKFKAVSPMVLDNTYEVMNKAKELGLIDELSSEAVDRAGGWAEIIKNDTSKEIRHTVEKASASEQFDISGKVDTENPIYKFYEKEVGKYLKNKYGATQITDAQGVKWWEVNVGKEQKGLPVEAFGVVGIGTAASIQDNK